MFFIDTKRIKISKASLINILEEVDTDKDGYISLYEFLTYIKSFVKEANRK